MRISTQVTALAVAAALLGGCGGTSNSGAVPSTTQANLTVEKLQIAVGTAFNATDATTGLNVVMTFRQPSGLSAVTADSPSITGPAGFTVPGALQGAYGSGNADAGTATISSSPQVPPNQAPANTTLGTFTGAFAYGLEPINSDNQSSGSYYPGNPNAYTGSGFAYYSTYDASGKLPFFAQPLGASAPADQNVFLLGPPAVPFFNDGTYPSGFAGYGPGFLAFEVTPVAGTYTGTVKITTTNGSSPSYSATGTIASVAALAAPVVAVTSAAGGGLSGTVTVGAGATETLVFINDSTSGNYYTVDVTGTGAHTWTLPASLGTCGTPSCENSASTAKPSLATGDTYVVQAISFDYPALEAAPPANVSQTPTIAGANGQADLSIGLAVPGTY